MRITDRPSPNFDDRGASVDMAILHYTGMQTAKAALDRLCDPVEKVSAHYVVEQDGAVWRLVAEESRAWHAGVSHWAGATDINARSIGIEIVNPGHEFGYQSFPEAQMAAVEELLGGIVARHDIAPARVVGHSDVAPSRKQDPGELFDWPRLARAGFAIWPNKIPETSPPPSDVPALLARIGYDPNAPLADVVAAFQRRFVPDAVSGKPDDITRRAIAAVAALQS